MTIGIQFPHRMRRHVERIITQTHARCGRARYTHRTPNAQFHTGAGALRNAADEPNAAAATPVGSTLPDTAPPSARTVLRPPLPPVLLPNLLGLSLPALDAALHASPLKLPKYRSRQLAHWMYTLGVHDFSKMDNFTKSQREELSHLFRIDYGSVQHESRSSDQTRKFLVGFESAKSRLLTPIGEGKPKKLEQVECVFIPMGDPASRDAPKSGAVCVSSQIGCSLTCAFCATGAMDQARLRNLDTSEIIGQVMIMKHAVGDFTFGKEKTNKAASTSPHPPRAVSNVVMMGMGEPLMNYRNVRGAIDVMVSHPRAGLGLGLGRPRVTLSTSGIAPALDKLLADYGGNISLAISLHAVNDQLRDELVPINKTYPLATLMEAVRRYQNGRVITPADVDVRDDEDSEGETARLPMVRAGRRRITFEYVMLRGVNDSVADARELIRLLHGIDSLVNLIPFNPWVGSSYTSSLRPQIEEFARTLEDGGLACTVRWPRGRDINGACGQLAIKHETPQNRWLNTQVCTYTRHIIGSYAFSILFCITFFST